LLVTIMDKVEHGELPRGSAGQLLEHFRGHPLENQLSARIGDGSELTEDQGELERVFSDALGRLREAALKHDIDSLNERARNGSLNAEEKVQYTDLLKRLSELQRHRPKSLIGKESV
jgi:hypothetical protein